jgi:hypothetical protein
MDGTKTRKTLREECFWMRLRNKSGNPDNRKCRGFSTPYCLSRPYAQGRHERAQGEGIWCR